MGDTNFALYMWYLIPAIIGAIFYEKNRVAGFFIGLAIAFVAITLFALRMGV